jgi:hypothetical protein
MKDWSDRGASPQENRAIASVAVKNADILKNSSKTSHG